MTLEESWACNVTHTLVLQAESTIIIIRKHAHTFTCAHAHTHIGRRIIHTYTHADTHALRYTYIDANTDTRCKDTSRQHTCKHTKLLIIYNYNYIPSKRANVVSYPQVNSCYFAICIKIPTVFKRCTCCTANQICCSN